MRFLPAFKSSNESATGTIRQPVWPTTRLRSGRGPLAAENSSAGQTAPLHALIIGIDKYKSKLINDLRGATADADAMDEYVRTELRVPADHVVNLRDKHATRKAIIRELKALSMSKVNRECNPILIYFAGHGATAPAPTDWITTSNRISAIATYDSLVKDCAGHFVCPIPDRTIGALLHKLAEAREGQASGDNITVILDCCHSGSGTRHVEQRPARLQRGFHVEQDLIPSTLDEDIWSMIPQDRSIDVAAGFAQSGCRSHVLLAACRETETAYEENGRGAFTRALLSTLRGTATDSITYLDLIQRLPDIPDQTPQCEGYNAKRLLFDALAPSTRRILYRVIERDHKYVMNAGSVHGVAHGAQFSIYSSPDFKLETPALATLVATAVGTCSTELSGFMPPRALATSFSSYFALQVSTADAELLRLHISFPAKRVPALRQLRKDLEDRKGLEYPAVLVHDKEEAYLGICSLGSNIVYPVYDPLITSLGLHMLYGTTAADTSCIHSVLRAAARFFWNLHRAPLKSQLRGNIDIQIHELRPDMHASLDLDLRRPFRTHGDNVLRSGTVDIVADGKTIYGVSIQNGFGVDLHAWVFFFDCSDLSINYYQPPASGRNGEASLPAHGTLSIGYGAGGGLPFKYFLRKNQETDIGFIKVFLSTEPVDLSYIMQHSAFDISGTRGSGRGPVQRPRHTWDTVLIPVIQRMELGKH